MVQTRRIDDHLIVDGIPCGTMPARPRRNHEPRLACELQRGHHIGLAFAIDDHLRILLVGVHENHAVIVIARRTRNLHTTADALFELGKVLWLVSGKTRLFLLEGLPSGIVFAVVAPVIFMSQNENPRTTIIMKPSHKSCSSPKVFFAIKMLQAISAIPGVLTLGASSGPFGADPTGAFHAPLPR